MFLCGNIMTAQYLLKDFNDLSLTSGGWTTQIIIDTTNWFVDSFGGDDFAKCTNYNSGNVPANTWLISPGVDLSSSTQPILNFQTIMKWPGAPLVLYISTDYDGTSNPTLQGTWTDITSQALWDVDNTTWGNWTNSGDVDLSAYKSSSTYIAYEYFGSSSSGSTWEIDNITINEGSTPPPTIDTVSVYDIQYTTDPNGNSNYVSQQIITGGIVTAVRSDSTFFISSGSGAWSGVYVYTKDYVVNIGDSVILDGEVDEYFDLTELVNVTNVQVISSGNNYNVNNCSTAAANSEDFEGCMVQVTNAMCVNDTAGFGEWIINDGTGDLTVDDLLFSYTPIINYFYDVTGPMTYNYGAYKLLPRDAADINQFVGLIENRNAVLDIYPNPTSDFIQIVAPEKTNASIFNMKGILVKKISLNSGINTINLGQLSSGNYMLYSEGNSYSIIVE